MSRLLLIDGNSILNRAFYGIMGSKMLTTKDGTYTNAVYGFLAIMFKAQEDLSPDHMAVTFDLKAPTARHKMYEGYKANRKGMPNELAAQMPIIKYVLRKMNITIIEKEGYEGDDILGTFARLGEEAGLDVTILSGDRDTFQLATDKVTIHIPRTKGGKTEIEDFDKEKVISTYEVVPKQLIEVKGLMGDSSDNIPGVPGVGEKTAYKLIKEYKTIENLYDLLEKDEAKTIKGKLKENLIQNKDLALLSRTLGTINVNVPIDDISVEDLKIKEWNKEEVYSIFKELNFKRYIDRFELSGEETSVKDLKDLFKIEENVELNKIADIIRKQEELIYYLYKNDDKDSKNIIKKTVKSISIYNKKEGIVYYCKINSENLVKYFKEIFENTSIKKYGYKLVEDYVLLKELGINPENIYYDAEIAAYDINPTNKYKLNDLSMEYLGIDINEFIEKENENKDTVSGQMNFFDSVEENDNEKYEISMYAYVIGNLYEKTMKKLEEYNSVDLFNNIEMPLLQVLAEMQFNGLYADKEELIEIGDKLKLRLNELTEEIHSLAGEDFNINSTKQLGVILFEKMHMPYGKKTKTGYSTSAEVLEKLRFEDPIVEMILEYRQLTKLKSTYADGLESDIDEKDGRIHTTFNQNVTATGRLSSTEPNLQNIPIRMELGRQIRKVFVPQDGYVFLDADYSQIELRVLAHMSEDATLIEAYRENADIHRTTAALVFHTPYEEVTELQRRNAKAVNFGIVYGISGFGLSRDLNISKKQAEKYIEDYFETYPDVKRFMDELVEQGKQKGYVTSLFGRIRPIPEFASKNFMQRQFGERIAMNSPIQGTAADIIKIAMIRVHKKLKEGNYKSRLILQIHDELLIETHKDEIDEVKQILETEMVHACDLAVPLIAEVKQGINWYEAK